MVKCLKTIKGHSYCFWQANLSRNKAELIAKKIKCDYHMPTKIIAHGDKWEVWIKITPIKDLFVTTA